MERLVDELRGQVEGTADGSPLSIQSNKQFGLFGGAQRSLIFDPSFERNRSSWIIAAGMRYLQNSTVARSGHYCLAMTPPSEGLVAIANQDFPIDTIPGNVIIVSGWAKISSGGGPSTGAVVAGAYDKDDLLITAATSPAVTLTTTYQLITFNAVVPALSSYLRFGVLCPQLDAGEVYWDDVVAYFLPFQDQHTEAAGPVTFTGTETVLGTVNIGSAQATGLYHVIVEADVTVTGGSAIDTYQLQIRRDNTSGAVLVGSTTGALSHGVDTIRTRVTGFDSAPNTVTQTYVLTGQRIAGAGTETAIGITMRVSQRNIAL